MASLLADPNVLAAEQNRVFRATGAPPGTRSTDPNYSEQWGLENVRQFGFGTEDADIDADLAWDVSTGSSDVIVAVVDTGVDMTHPELADRIWTNPGEVANGLDDGDPWGLVDDLHGWDWVGANPGPGDPDDEDDDPSDENGHGTHVAGIIAADGDDGTGGAGVAWDATIMPLRVLNDDGEGSTADIAAAFDYAGEMGAHIVNASLGSTGFPEPASLRLAIRDHPGTMYVVAAGNGGDDGIGDNVGSVPEWPCRIDEPNVVCVAASNEFDSRAEFSNFSSDFVHLAAPGTNIISSWLGSPVASTGTYALTDSVSGFYGNDQDLWAKRDASVDLSAETNCSIHYDMWTSIYWDGEPGIAFGEDDIVVLDLSTDGTSWTAVDGWTGWSSGYDEKVVDLDAVAGDYYVAALHLRFAMTSSPTIVDEGVYIDDVRIVCDSGTIFADDFEGGSLAAAGWSREGGSDWAVTDVGFRWSYSSGTSMATPMVAGAAAVLWGERGGGAGGPDADWVQHIIGVLRGGLDQTKTWMTNKTIWGGRLNMANSMAFVGDLDPPVPPSIAATDVGKTWQRGLRFDVRSTTTNDVGPAGVRSYDVQKRATTYRGGFGSWATLFSEQRTGSFKGATGRTYCFRARATDNAFNAGDWSARRCTSIPVNDRALDASAGWNEVTPSGSFRGTAMRATARGSTLKLTKVKAKELALVATRCGACGKVAVFRGGKRLAVIDLSGSLERNKVFPVKTFAKVTKPATITIKVLSRGKTVMVEGLGVSRT